MSNRAQYSGQVPELVPQALRGYRFWKIVSDPTPNDPILKGQYNGYWYDKTYKAQCKIRQQVKFKNIDGVDVVDDESIFHAAPDESCTCGIYSRYTIDSYMRDLMSPKFIIGSIKATGTTLLGSKGFRTANAEIEALLIVVNLYDWAPKATDLIYEQYERLAARYDVPLYEDSTIFLADYPPADLSALGINVGEDEEEPRNNAWLQQMPIPVPARQGGKDEQYDIWLAHNANVPGTMFGCLCPQCRDERRRWASRYTYMVDQGLLVDQQRLQEDFDRLKADQQAGISINVESGTRYLDALTKLLLSPPQNSLKGIARDLMGGGA